MDSPTFSSLEKAVSFYTRNDFAILNTLLFGDFDTLWGWVWVAYGDNQGIINEYENGTRTIQSEYDVKWLNCLRERLINELDEPTKVRVLETARADIANILGAMVPAEEELHLFRTAWIDEKYALDGTYPYSREYKAIRLTPGSLLEIKTITSCSLTPYREDEDVGSSFYRYEFHVPKGQPVLELDQFVTHNEPGEVLLPPMLCSVTDISKKQGCCKGIITLEYLSPLICKG